MHANNDEVRLPDDQVRLVVEVFRMLADAHPRASAVGRWADREMSVNENSPSMWANPRPRLSQHLAKLRMARLVQTRREGTTIFYSPREQSRATTRRGCPFHNAEPLRPRSSLGITVADERVADSQEAKLDKVFRNNGDDQR